MACPKVLETEVQDQGVAVSGSIWGCEGESVPVISSTPLVYLAVFAVPWLPLRLPDLCLRRHKLFSMAKFPHLVTQLQRICLPVQEMQEMWVWSLGQEEPLEEEMATHSSLLAWRAVWTEEPCRLQSMGS